MVLFLRLRSPEQSLDDERRFHEEPFEYAADLEAAIKTVSLDLFGPERIECPSPSRVPRSGQHEPDHLDRKTRQAHNCPSPYALVPR
jgi:hypothetical protein